MSNYHAMRRKELARLKAIRKQAFLDRCSLQAKFAKAKLIITPRGKNGRSMSNELLAKHGISKPSES